MTAGRPSQFQRYRKRARHLSMTGSSSVAGCQFFPPSTENRVMTDLHSMTKLNWRHLPSGIGSV